MKALKNLTLAGLAVLLAGTAAMAGIPERTSVSSDNPNVIIFRVAVHMNSDLALDRTYMVQLTDEHGTTVAPPQRLIPGVNSYTFTRVLWPDGVHPLYVWRSRVIARLVPVVASDPGTSAALFAHPDGKLVFWVPGRTYLFNLWPSLPERKGSPGLESER